MPGIRAGSGNSRQISEALRTYARISTLKVLNSRVKGTCSQWQFTIEHRLHDLVVGHGFARGLLVG
jgi:hypothetical protein